MPSTWPGDVCDANCARTYARTRMWRLQCGTHHRDVDVRLRVLPVLLGALARLQGGGGQASGAGEDLGRRTRANHPLPVPGYSHCPQLTYRSGAPEAARGLDAARATGSVLHALVRWERSVVQLACTDGPRARAETELFYNSKPSPWRLEAIDSPSAVNDQAKTTARNLTRSILCRLCTHPLEHETRPLCLNTSCSGTTSIQPCHTYGPAGTHVQNVVHLTPILTLMFMAASSATR